MSARSQIAEAKSVMDGAGVEARTRLAEAERQLGLSEVADDPVEALDTARRAVATEELSQGDRPLALVMRHAGFSSPSSFSRWFHHAYGIQPSEFRRLAQL